MELYLINTGSSYELYSKKKIAALVEDAKEEHGQIGKVMSKSLVDRLKDAEDYVNNKILDRFPRVKKVSNYGARMVRAYRDFIVGSHGQIYLDIMQRKQPIDIYYSPSIKAPFARYTYLRLARREIIKQVSLCILTIPLAAAVSVVPPPGVVTPVILLGLAMYSIKTALSAKRSKKYISFKKHEGLGVLEDVLAGKLDSDNIDDSTLLEYYGKRKIKKKR